MPAILPVVLTAAHLMLVSGVPTLNVKPSCQAAAQAAVGQSRDTKACLRDEDQARDKLKTDWNSYSSAQRERCLRLSQLGGMPSYVELLTCLQMAKDVKSVPQTDYGLGGGLSPSKPLKSGNKK